MSRSRALRRRFSRAALLAAAAGLAVAAVAIAQTTPKPAPATGKPASPKPSGQPKAAPTPAPSPAPVDGGWPREVLTSAGKITVYQPQVDAWDGSRLAVLAAFSLEEKVDAKPIYGVVWADGRTVIDKEKRLVTLTDRQLTKLVIPSAPEKQAALL